MNVLDYMAMEICETKCANKRLTKALILVSTIGLYSLTKQLMKEKERREVVKNNEAEINKYKERLNKIYGMKDFTETSKGE